MLRNPAHADPSSRSQHRSRAAWGLLLAAVAFVSGLVPAAALAGPAPGTRTEHATLQFRIVIPATLRMRMVRQPAQFVVTERDAKAGYVELPDGVEIEVVSNLRAGHTMMVQVASPFVKAVEVSGLGEPMKAGLEAAAIRFPRVSGKVTRSLFNLGFRLLLARNVGPGVYDWPVSLTVVPA